MTPARTLVLEAPPGTTLAMPGLEPDNLLAFLALLGALRAIEESEPGWRPRASWGGPPWTPRLHLAAEVDPAAAASAAARGLAALAGRFDVDRRANVDFADRNEFRKYALRVQQDPTAGALAAALSSELPPKRAGGLYPAPLVMMFGQGHQNFLERLVAVARGDLPPRLKKAKGKKPNLRDPEKIREALFEPWRRQDRTDGFRWDPEEDQRYALRFDDPSGAGAAPTVHGANRLAAVGLLSFAGAPASNGSRVPGVVRRGAAWHFVWPLWAAPLSVRGIESLLAHGDVLAGRLDRVRPFGVVEIMSAQRISNGKFMNVSRARPMSRGV